MADTKSPPRICRVNTRRGQFGPGNPGKPFKSGNPGRPKGARNKSTTMLARLFDGEAEEIGRKAVELAKEGRVGAVRLVLDRAYPSRRGRVVEGLKLPPINSAADAVTAMGAIARAISAGALTIEDARDLSAIIDVFRKTHELAEIERRIAALEKEESPMPRHMMRLDKLEVAAGPQPLLVHVKPGQSDAKAVAAHERTHGKIPRDAKMIVIRHTFTSRI